MDWLSIILWGLGAVAVFGSIIPIWRTTRWWVRVLDFPRFQIALLALVVLVVTPLLRPPEGPLDWMLLGSLVGVLLWQSNGQHDKNRHSQKSAPCLNGAFDSMIAFFVHVFSS